LSKTPVNSYIIFQVFFSTLILTLFLCIFFPLIHIGWLLAISVMIIGSLIFVTNKCKDKPLKQMSIQKRYLYERIGIGLGSLFLDVSSLSIMGVIVMFLFEKSKNGFDYVAMAIMGVLGGVCLYFGILLTRTFIIRYKSFEIYRSKLLEEELGGIKPSNN